MQSAWKIVACFWSGVFGLSLALRSDDLAVAGGHQATDCVLRTCAARHAMEAGNHVGEGFGALRC